jgi:ornithine--oxo-acid transaminase
MKDENKKHSEYYIGLEKRVTPGYYNPIPAVIARGEGVWVWDVEERKYLDMLSAYSAVSHGHLHPRIMKAVNDQLHRLALISRAFYSDKLPVFLEKLCMVSGMEEAVPMNTGAEAVETAIKAARRWGYNVKGIKKDCAEIIVCENNFHGRTTTIISFSTEEEYRKGFGPYTPGFKAIPFNDAEALEKAITPNTCAFLVEPMQGEAGIIIPSKGYLKKVREICDKHNVLLILDEIQTGLGRTGEMFAFQHEGIKPDGLILGKALGGGVIPVSAVVGKKEYLDVLGPGSHGSTFGGNPLASAVGLEALQILEDEKLVERSAELGAYLLKRYSV